MSARLTDVEALTAIVEPIIDYAGDLPWSESSGPRAQNIARAILASDWLAARLAEAAEAHDGRCADCHRATGQALEDA